MRIFINGNQEVDPRLVNLIIKEYKRQEFEKIKKDAIDAEFIERRIDAEQN